MYHPAPEVPKIYTKLPGNKHPWSFYTYNLAMMLKKIRKQASNDSLINFY